MSINLHIEAEKPIQDENGNILKHCIEFDVWQTSTSVTDKILRDSNPIQAYKDWVLSFDSSDLHNLAHIEQLNYWLENIVIKGGYELDICGW